MMVRLLVPWVEELPIQAAALSSCLTEMKRIMKYGDDDFWANMENTEEMLVDAAKNAEAYAERIQFLDDKSLSLIMWEAADDVRGALKILRDYYQDKGKPHIINLYTDLTSLQKSDSESVTEYVICTETTITTQLWGHRGDVGCSNRWQRDEGSYAVATERETRQGRWPGSREGSSRTGVFQMQKEETVQRPRRSCKVSGETEDQDKQYIFQVSEGSAGDGRLRGATSHIITDLAKFKRFDEEFQADNTAWSWLTVCARGWQSAVAMQRSVWLTAEADIWAPRWGRPCTSHPIHKKCSRWKQPLPAEPPWSSRKGRMFWSTEMVQNSTFMYMTDYIICTQRIMKMMTVVTNAGDVLIRRHGMRFWGTATRMTFRGYKVLMAWKVKCALRGDFSKPEIETLMWELKHL